MRGTTTLYEGVGGWQLAEERTKPFALTESSVPGNRQPPTANSSVIGISIAAFAIMLRRVLALAGIVVVIALAVTLLVRVWVHHTQAEPYVEDDRAIVALDANFARARG